jgi:beta-glucosidase
LQRRKAADVVVLAIGESESMSGEAQSRTEIIVPPAQQALAEAIAATGKPVVVLLRTGRALALTGAVRNADAMLVTWFLGAETGHAIADVLFGDVSPSGRLPVSFPQAPGQVPYYYAHKSTGRAPAPGPLREYTTRYRELTAAPLYAFGHGLGYSTIEYSSPSLNTERMAWDGRVRASATLHNTGTRAVDETAQLYVHDKVASVTRPVRELKDFQRVHLAAGESREVSFELSRADLEFIGADMKPVAESGDFELWIAPSAVEGESKTFTLSPHL